MADAATTFHRLRVAEVREETADAVSLRFEVPAELADTYAYRPGQFLTLRIPESGGSSLARCYSLSSSPHDGSDLTVTVKRVEGGRGSGWLCDNVVAGSELDTLPPAGTFTPRSVDSDLLLIAAGSGITPVMSILRTVLATGKGKLVLLYANRDEQSVIFAEELRELADAHPGRLQVVHWLESLQGLPSRALLAELAQPFRDREAFLCGPTPFMDAASHALRDLDVPRKKLHIERFVSLTEDPFDTAEVAAEVTAGIEASDSTPETHTSETTVEVQLDGEKHTFSWPSGTLLLDLLRDRGLDAPFSCREGACSACACRVTSGEVRMRRNEVLDRTDLDEGYVLACQSDAVTDSVSITYDE
ncbi:ferredoxin--NADP reductase [Pseudonocardia spinosispora]|uniref:ferredoxin--NADP reductase n=1 Tax=Pseudonocardia spinosispora TaxID=103441 RepID=UPI000403DACD|nr:ferredoxin--NADP reductase [Pseudonocardia spinosispora]